MKHNDVRHGNGPGCFYTAGRSGTIRRNYDTRSTRVQQNCYGMEMTT